MKKYSFNKKYLIQFCEEILISFILHIWLIRYAILLIIFFSYIFFNENSGFWILFWKYFVIFNVIYLLCNILLSIDNKLEIKNLEKRRKLDQEIEGVKIRGDKLKLDFLNQKISKTKNGFVNKYIPHFFKKKYYKDDGYGDWHRMLTKIKSIFGIGEKVIIDDEGTIIRGEFYENGELKKGKIVFKDQTTRATVDSKEVKLVGRVEKGEFYENGILKKGKITDQHRTREGEFYKNGELKNGKLTNAYALNRNVGLFNWDTKKVYKNGKLKKITYRNGQILEGEFHGNGKLKKGKKTYPSGFEEEGEFDENGDLIFVKKYPKKMRKKITTPEGDTYEGKFYENGKLKNGKVTYADGSISEGEFNESGGLKYGRMTQPNGRSLKLAFKKGKITFSSESIFEGEFYQNGNLKKGQITFKHGEIHESKLKGVILGVKDGIIKGEFDENGNLKNNDEITYVRDFWKEVNFGYNGLIQKTTIEYGIIELGKFHKNGKLKNGKRTFPKDFLFLRSEEGEFDENGKLKNGKKTYHRDSDYFRDKVEEGEFDENGKLKNGKIIEPDGAIKKGEFHKNGALKYGKYTFVEGVIYEGNFNYYNQLTHGRETRLDGTVIEHLFDSDDKKITQPNGTILVGFFDAFENLTAGKVIHSDGILEEGIFDKNGQLIKGKMTHPDGRVELVDES